MTNTLIRMAFCGTRYHGFQVQRNALTVCETLQDAMEKVLGARPPVKGCSRTDAGVHARDFCVSFFSDAAIPAARLPLALNAALPADIRVFHAQAVPGDFHARYSAIGKVYRYHFLNSPVDDAFAPHLVHRVAGALDEEAMARAGRCFLGRHDFSAFASSHRKAGSPLRTISDVSVHRRGRRVTLSVAGDGFLYNMVRIMAGTLLLVGRGALAPEAVTEILAQRDRRQAGSTLPAKGLFLHEVRYPRHMLEMT